MLSCLPAFLREAHTPDNRRRANQSSDVVEIRGLEAIRANLTENQRSVYNYFHVRNALHSPAKSLISNSLVGPKAPAAAMVGTHARSKNLDTIMSVNIMQSF
jgi:hypothetical protein